MSKCLGTLEIAVASSGFPGTEDRDMLLEKAHERAECGTRQQLKETLNERVKKTVFISCFLKANSFSRIPT